MIDLIDVWPPVRPHATSSEPLIGQDFQLGVVKQHGKLVEVLNGTDPDAPNERVLTWEPAPGAAALAATLIAEHWGKGRRWIVAIEAEHLVSAAALSPWAIDPIAAALAELEVPLAVSVTGGGNLVALYELASRIPNLRLLIRRATGCTQGLLLTFLETCPNAYMTTNVFQDQELVTAARIGGNRLLFGSPRYRSIASEVARIRVALSDTDQAQIWAPNAFGLLGWPTKSAPNKEK